MLRQHRCQANIFHAVDLQHKLGRELINRVRFGTETGPQTRGALLPRSAAMETRDSTAPLLAIPWEPMLLALPPGKHIQCLIAYNHGQKKYRDDAKRVWAETASSSNGKTLRRKDRR
jgi:hypothetical protein